MGFKYFLFGYGRGRNLGRGQSVIQSTPVTLTEGPPSFFSEKSLKAICSIVVPFYYYWLELSWGSIWFIQTPPGKGLGERQFNLMSNAFNEFLS